MNVPWESEKRRPRQRSDLTHATEGARERKKRERDREIERERERERVAREEEEKNRLACGKEETMK